MLLSGSQGNYFALSPQNIFHGFRQSYCEIAGPNSTFLLCLIISRVLSNILCFIFPPTLETKSCQSWRFTNNVCDILLTYISPPPFILLPHFFFYLTLIEPSTFLLYIYPPWLLPFTFSSKLLSLSHFLHQLSLPTQQAGTWILQMEGPNLLVNFIQNMERMRKKQTNKWKQLSERKNNHTLPKSRINVFKVNNDAYTKIKSTVSHRIADPPVQEFMLETKPLNFPNK